MSPEFITVAEFVTLGGVTTLTGSPTTTANLYNIGRGPSTTTQTGSPNATTARSIEVVAAKCEILFCFSIGISVIPLQGA